MEVGGEGVGEDEGDAPELTAVSNRRGNGRREGIDAQAKFRAAIMVADQLLGEL